MNETAALHVLVVTSEWASDDLPNAGVFVRLQVEMLRRHGLHVDVYPYRGRANPIRYIAEWLKYRRFLRGRRFDVVHAHFGQSALITLPSRIPVVVTFHGSDLEGFIGTHGRPTLQGRVLRSISRCVARRADRVILVSESLRRQLPAGISAEVIPGGVDDSQFRPMDQRSCRRSLGWNETSFIMLFAADPANPIKRYHLAEEVLGGLPAELNAELKVANGVPHARMPVWMNAADLLLLPSANEGSPTVVKEAIACGLPVVATDVGDVRERLTGLKGSRVCATNSVEELINGVVALHEIITTEGRPVPTADTVIREHDNVAPLITIYEQIKALKRI